MDAVARGAPFAAEVLIRFQRFANPETGWAVLDAEHDGDAIVLVGPLAHLEVRERVRVEGTWQHDKRFGPQVRVATAAPVGPSGEAALRRLSRRVRHVGRARAEQLLRAHGEDVLEAIDRDPLGRVPRGRAEPAARRRGGALVGRAALHPRAAPAAGAARARPGSCRGSRSTTPAAGTAWCASGRTT